MAIVNKGSQEITFDYKEPTKSEEFNKLLRAIIKPGFYKGGTLSVLNNTTARLSVFEAFLNVDSDKAVKITTASTVDISVTEASPLIYMKLDWVADTIDNYADFDTRATTDSPVTNEIKIGKALFTAGILTGFDVSSEFRDSGIFDENYNITLDGNFDIQGTATFESNIDMEDNRITDMADPVDDKDAVNKQWVDANALTADRLNESLTPIQERLESAERKNLEQDLTLGYLTQNIGEGDYTEFFFNDTQLEEQKKPVNSAIIMDDTNFKNNWKIRDGQPEWKNGFLKNENMHFMLEVIDRYDLTNVGYAINRGITYDPINNCYWLLTSVGDLNTAGQISKLSINMKDGQINTLATWNLSAPGASAAWSAIAVDPNGSNLYFAYFQTAASKIYGIKINEDGSLGEDGYRKVSGETIDLTNSVFGSHTDSTASSFLVSMIIWDDVHLAFLLGNFSTQAHTIKFVNKTTFGAGTRADITGTDAWIGGSAKGRNMTKEGNILWIKVNDNTDDYRKIFRFDVSDNGTTYTGDLIGDIDGTPNSPVILKSSGTFEITYDEDIAGTEGICISEDGNMLEMIGTASNGTYLSKRAIKNAKWAENQICEVFNPASIESNLSSPHIIMLEYTGEETYYWTGDGNVTSEQVDVYRYKLSDGTYKHARLTGFTTKFLRGLEIVNGGFFVLIENASLQQRVYVDNSSTGLTDFIALMGDTYHTSNNNIILGTDWGTLASGVGTTTDKLRGLAYDSDSNVLLVNNDTDDKIDTISLDGTTWTQGVYDLWAAIGEWGGIAYKNKKIFVVNRSNAADTPSEIFVIDKEKSTSTQSYILHQYQDPSLDFAAWSTSGIEFDREGNLFFSSGELIMGISSLENAEIMQLQSFIYAESFGPISLSDTIEISPIQERYFEPEDFVEWLPVDANGKLDMSGSEDHYEWLQSTRNVPHKKYAVALCKNDGIVILNLDEFLSDVSSAGMPRRDTRKILITEYEANNYTSITTDANIFSYDSGTFTTESLFVHKEMIFIGTSDGTSRTVTIIIDLKNGKAWHQDGSNNAFYKGTLSERNDGKGYEFHNDSNLAFGSGGADVFKFHARTFTKDDISDYNGEYPATFVLIGQDGYGCHLMKIDWDESNNRSFTKVYENIANDVSVGVKACWIAPSGKIFLGDYIAAGPLYEFSLRAWEVASDTVGTGTSIGDSGGFMSHIAENSIAWKTSSGEWRHIIYCSTDNTTSGDQKFVQIDVENQIFEDIYTESFDNIKAESISVFEDIVFGVSRLSGFFSSIFMMKKLYFDDLSATQPSNNWSAATPSNQSSVAVFTETKRPRLFLPSADSRSIVNFSGENLTLSFLNGLDLSEFGYFPRINKGTHKSVEFDAENPESFSYVQNALTPSSEITKVVDKRSSDIIYTDGATETWSNKGSIQSVQLEDASIINPEINVTGKYLFGKLNLPENYERQGYILKNSTGASLIEGTDYEYDKALDNSDSEGYDIYDDNNSGAFDANKYIRVVEDGANVTSTLSLDVYAKNLSSWVTPPSDQIYIDPERGKLVLPSPSFFSKCENWIDEKVYIGNAEFIQFGNGKKINDKLTSKFGLSSYGFYSTSSEKKTSNRIKPLSLRSGNDSPNKGTASFWVADKNNNINDGSIEFFNFVIGDYTVKLQDVHGTGQTVQIFYKGVSKSSASYTWSSHDSIFQHVYIVWNKDGISAGSDIIKVYVNGTLRTSYDGTDGILNPTIGSTYLEYGVENLLAGNISQFVDNIKIWEDEIDTVTWLYNSGTGRENALHEIYGSDNGYIPELTIGYHYLDTDINALELNEDGATEGNIVLQNITGYNKIGINFEKEDDGGIALVNIWETSNSIADTGNTYANTTIDNLTSTANLEIGMLVSGSGIASLTKIQAINSSTSITVDRATTATASGVSLNFYNVIISDDLVDLYYGVASATDKFSYYVFLEASKTYTIRVDHSGAHNTNSSTNYPIRIEKFLLQKTIESEVSTKIFTWHSDDREEYYYDLTPNESTSSEKITYFNGDNSTTEFDLQDGDPKAKAYVPTAFSKDGGTTWLLPYSLALTWGSNSPNYDNETVDSDGNFIVKFDEAPTTGTNNVVIKWTPKVNKYRIETTLIQPNDGNEFVDFNKVIELLDHGVELI